MTREILTIQLGHYANFVGTHLWNIQETNFSYDPENPSEINHDVLYREGELQKRVTYTPRLLIADLKGTLGYLSNEGNLSEILGNENKEIPEILWEENRLETITEPDATKSSFLKNLEVKDETNNENINLEEDINKWVDYLIPRYHSRTVNVITDYEHASTIKPFDIFHYGQNVWNNRRFSDDFIDRIRAYVEECDGLQGFQVLIDADDGFAGLGSSCIQYLRDEYGKSILTCPVIDAAPRDRSLTDYVKIINTVLCWQQLGEFSSLFSPLCCDTNCWLTPNKPRIFKNVIYKSDLKYHTSSLLATALETFSLRYRHKKYPMSTLSDLCADLNKFGRKAVATSLSLPFPMNANKDLIDVLDDLEGTSPWTTLTPSCNITMDNNMQSLSLRGIPENRLKRPLKDAQEQMQKTAYRCSTVHEMMSFYLDCSCYSTASYLISSEQALKIKNPYPKLFNSEVQENGNILNKERVGDVESIPVMAGLHTGKFIAEMYEALHKHVKKIKSLNKFHAFLDSGLEQDDFNESVNNLIDCKENYEDQH